MNLQEFLALEIGDKIENAMTSGEGTVTAVAPSGSDRLVSVEWGPTGIKFSYSVHSTAWFHWSRVAKPSEEPSLLLRDRPIVTTCENCKGAAPEGKPCPTCKYVN